MRFIFARRYFVIILLLLTNLLQAQHAKVTRAEKLMKLHNYTAAIDLFLDVLELGNDPDAIQGIAECYRRIGNADESEYWFGLACRLPNPKPNSWLYYAQALQMNGKYFDAKKWAEKYLSEVDPNNIQAMWLLKSCEESTVKGLNVSGKLYQVSSLEEVNTENDEFSPAFFRDDIVFVSSREHPAHIKNYNRWTDEEDKPFTELYITKRVKIGDEQDFKYNYSDPEKFSKSLSSNYHDGPLSFNADFNTVYFTRSSDTRADDGIIRLNIYKATGSPQNYSDPIPLPFNGEEYSVIHPSISRDGSMLFFSSDMPGGYGGFDLYVSYYDQGKWSPPDNLGPTVNTEGSEVFPFIHESGNLYFASNGLIGLGGLDVFRTKLNYGVWIDPVNIGYPINTTKDDFGFIANRDQTHGYFSSNRKGMGGDDIFTFSKLSVTVEVNVFDEETNMPIEGADVFTPCSDVQNSITNQDGRVILELPLNTACDFASEKIGYQPNSVRLPKKMVPGKTVFIQIPLKTECVFVVSGTVMDGLTEKTVDSALVRLQTYCSGEIDEVSVYTDSRGRYEFRNVREDCDIRVTVTKTGFTRGSTTFKTGTNCGDEAQLNGQINEFGAIVKTIPVYCFGADCENMEKDQKDPLAMVDYGPTIIPSIETKDYNDFGTDNQRQNNDQDKETDWDKVENIVSSNNNDKSTNNDVYIDPKVKSSDCVSDSIYNMDGSIQVMFCDGTSKIISSDGLETYLDENNNEVDRPNIGNAQLVHIFYDYDDATIRTDARKGLDDLVLILEAYPQAKIKITSHTDARGNKSYNLKLSKKRADAVVRYLVDSGISKSRLTAKGMGEEVMLNDCYDGIECSETQHQENRRTEFTIIEYIPAALGDGKSLKPGRIKTRACANCPSASEVETE